MSHFPIQAHPMEPIGPLSQRATKAPRLLDSLMTVQPLLWAMDVERANQKYPAPSGQGFRPASNSVWRELAYRSRQRGTSMLSRKQWPGPIFLPAWIVQNLLTQRSIVSPLSWEHMVPGSAAKLIGLLGAWQGDRGIYEFSVLPSKIIRQSEVNVVLDIKTFSDMPSFAIYIDLENVRDPMGMDHVPPGFLVGLNMQNESFELVMASLDGVKILVETIPLDGSSLDSYIFKTRHGEAGPGKKGRLSIMLAALLLVCFYKKKAEPVHDGSADFGIVKVWNRWRLGEGFSDSIFREYQAARARTSSMDPSLVAHWGPLDQNDKGVMLRCSVGLSFSLKKFQLAKSMAAPLPLLAAAMDQSTAATHSTATVLTKPKRSRQKKDSLPALGKATRSSKKKSAGVDSSLQSETTEAGARDAQEAVPSKIAKRLKRAPNVLDPDTRGLPAQIKRSVAQKIIQAARLEDTVKKAKPAQTKTQPVDKPIKPVSVKAKGIAVPKTKK